MSREQLASSWERLTSQLPEPWREYAPYAAAAVAALLLLALLSRLLRRGSVEDDEAAAASDGIDLSTLTQSLPAQGAQLEVYGVPVRLAAVAVAPAGRGAALSDEEALVVVGQLAPRLGEVARAHRPRWLCWPSQLSAQGFRTTFAHRSGLPGQQGRGTRWCTATGKVTLADRQWLIGMVLWSETPNPLGDIEVDHEGRWPDVLRVRADA